MVTLEQIILWYIVVKVGQRKKILTIDFQLLHWGNPMEDIAYLLSNSVSPENLEEHQEKYLSVYFDELVRCGVDDYSFEQLMLDYREQLIYCILMPALSAMDKTKEENMTENQKIRSESSKKWRNRVCSAITANKCSEVMDQLSACFDSFEIPEPSFPELDPSVSAIVDFFTKVTVDWKNRELDEYRTYLSLTIQSYQERIPAKEEGMKSITTYEGTETCPTLRIFEPIEKKTKIILYISSAWVGGVDLDEQMWRKTCIDSGAYLVAVKYRNSPEHKHEELLEDCYNALKNVTGFPEKYSLPKVEGVTLIGVRQGGHLVACLLKKLVESGEISLVSKQILICPWLDPTCSDGAYESIGNRYNNLIGTDNCKWHWKHYVNEPLEDFKNSEQPLAFGKEVAQFPPTFVITSEFDVTKGEAHAYCDLLKSNQVDVEVKMYEGTIFSFYTFYIAKGVEAMGQVASNVV
mmetsp:Transcript_65565/g.98882  ORF Transcript_65565/g.98882 Transcript_65565/m.98882 type:complete len:464 (+) Transcript_65565:658-2049(+)